MVTRTDSCLDRQIDLKSVVASLIIVETGHRPSFDLESGR